ncbi:MAG: hypothetical protein IJM35_01485 [Bacteroidales bacterium]|nr:hypothetical protein [Bacteroidales bacterium]
MKRISIILFASFASLWACDVKPAEEEIANTGAAGFSASFQMPSGSGVALWESGDKLVVVDTRNGLHRFDMDAGISKPEGEFSGTLSENSQVKYVIYSHDPGAVTYDPATETFTLNVPETYNAKEAGTLVKANAAAIGIPQGGDIALQSVCGFIKFTLPSNGKTLEQGGKTFSLTDIKKVTIMDNDGKSFAGTVHASWPEGTPSPAFVSVEEGSATITFRTHALSTANGDTFYEAGDYYLPVVPQNYEHVRIDVEDTDGNEAVAVAERAIDVQAAALSNLHEVSWPTVVIEANFESNTKAESDSHTGINSNFVSANLSCDRAEIGNPTNIVEGGTKKKYEYTVPENGYDYIFWTTNGIGRNTKSLGNNTYGLIDVVFNAYVASWARDGKNWIVGSQQEVAWIKFPSYDGVLTRVEMYYYDNACGPWSVSSEVDPDTGLGTVNMASGQISTKSGTFKWLDILVPDAERGKPYYFVMGPGGQYRIRGWKLTYKVFN